QTSNDSSSHRNPCTISILIYIRRIPLIPLFFFTAPATTEIYTLSLHDALPISAPVGRHRACALPAGEGTASGRAARRHGHQGGRDRKSTRLNSSHVKISYAVFCLKKKKKKYTKTAKQSFQLLQL